jgi:hypothetical protein
MKKRIAPALLAFIITNATAGIDSQTFYTTREGQVFKNEDMRELEQGYVKGDDSPYFTWKGFVSGKPLYFEVHDEQIKLVVSKKQTTSSFSSAPSISGGDTDGRAINEKGSDLFIKSSKDPKQSLICIESIGPDIYTHPRPYKEVYLITDPVGFPHIYRLSSINASCKGVVQTPKGKIFAPSWTFEENPSPKIFINYYQADKNRFLRSDIQITGTTASEDAQLYNIDGTD